MSLLNRWKNKYKEPPPEGKILEFEPIGWLCEEAGVRLPYLGMQLCDMAYIYGAFGVPFEEYYKHIFEVMGVTDEAVRFAVDHARLKLDITIDNITHKYT